MSGKHTGVQPQRRRGREAAAGRRGESSTDERRWTRIGRLRRERRNGREFTAEAPTSADYGGQVPGAEERRKSRRHKWVGAHSDAPCAQSRGVPAGRQWAACGRPRWAGACLLPVVGRAHQCPPAVCRSQFCRAGVPTPAGLPWRKVVACGRRPMPFPLSSLLSPLSPEGRPLSTLSPACGVWFDSGGGMGRGDLGGGAGRGSTAKRQGAGETVGRHPRSR